ncbi:MAG TPA: acyl-CoA dehydrogenase family protein [Thermodesulfobacteriota bacterium]|nr:acyl-CoA dehydrogenase family protein [Thermodesulfobacteriota bacterium]
MDFTFTEEQVRFKESVVKFSLRELNDGVTERDKKGEFFREGWRKCADFGILGLPVPKEYGGLEADIVTCAVLMQGLGYACRDSGLLFVMGSHIWTCEIPILHFGTKEQKEKFLPRLCKGEIIGGHAITEPDSGSDAFGLKTTAVKDGDRYILNGSKMFISNAPIADILLIFARTDKAKGFGGISAFIVEKGFPGFSVGKPLEKMGLKTAPIGEVILQDCPVPVENRLGKEGMASAIFNSEMDWERCCLFATQLGVMEYQVETCVKYAKERPQFGKPIGKYQSISHKIADMKMRIELGSLILYKVAWMKAQGKKAPIESAIAKVYVSESYVKSSLDAIQIHGGYGYMTEFGLEKDLRDSIAGKIYSGTSEIQRNIIASWLGL